MMSMSQVMRTLKFPSGKEIGADVAKIKNFIQKQEQKRDGKQLITDWKWEDEKNFDGNFHCETLMLALELLKRSPVAHEEISSVKNNTNTYLRLPSKEVVDSFADPAKVLPVSKRCCPACHALMKYVNENSKEKILYPGYHENWFTAALPPWLPRKAGMAVIEAAETKLVERIETYLEHGIPLSDSSTGSSPITSNNIDDFEDISPEEDEGLQALALRWKDKRRHKEEEEDEPDAGCSGSPTKKRSL